MAYGDLLKKYLELDRSSFHVPGHKGNLKFNFLSRLHRLNKAKKLSEFDLTELESTDDLYNPGVFVGKIEDRLCGLYGSGISVVSTGGNTLCIQTMLRFFLPCGGKILIARNIHKSALNAMILLKISPIWINDLPYEQVSVEQVKDSLKRNKNISAVFITSPDYFGRIADISKIKKIIGNIPLIVDNAHGAHLKFLNSIDGRPPMHPIDLGADACADSAHKTLPVLTGGAWLHISKNVVKNLNFKSKDIKSFMKNDMSLFGSSSPSFLTLISIQEFLNLFKFKTYINLSFKKKLEKIKKIKDKALKFGVLDKSCSDPMRILLDFSKFCCNDKMISEYFFKNKIEPEFVFDKKVVLISSIFNKNKDFTRLENALEYQKLKSEFKARSIFSKKKCFGRALFKIPIKKSLFLPYKIVKVVYSLGEVSAQVICNYPPGVPFIFPGQLIGIKELKYLVENNFSYIKVIK
ncbi:MAG: amino acid decarboxylase [Candidatus Improbicoccus pseudotrichonymphae]|uniref:Amino acid decarboxylase n=1 Tax=Candidatus Improbicoccus pseudotrichonymphae TaxID=3033792 RepID=A0AA48KWU7_9FIRM|nr:MAG: amino acid decarboxylase [Candidatus Improbicoccus pseudotrichonymphae]